MKKNKVIGLGLALMLGLSLIGCQENNKSNGNSGGSQKKQESSEKTEKKENSKKSGKVTVDTSWYENDGNAISSGIFVVGESLKSGDYTFTAKRNHSSDTSAIVAVFESLDKYKEYFKTSKELISNNNSAAECLANSSYYYKYLRQDESCTMALSDGNVLMLEDVNGTLADNSNSDSSVPELKAGKDLVSGIYSSKQIGEGTYIISCGDTGEEDSRANVVLFENEDAYKTYSKSDAYSVADYEKAVGESGFFDCVMQPGETTTVIIGKDTRLLVDYGTCYIQKVKMNWSVDESK